MSSFQKIGETVKENNVSNGNKYKSNNDSNLNGKYALDKNKFKPNTEEAMLAEEIATHYNDLQNYAAFFNVVNKLGITKARQYWSECKDEINSKKGTKYEIRLPNRYFVWKIRRVYNYKY